MGIDEINIEADGFITREQDIKPLEKVTDNTANPTADCPYPNCEACSKYFTFDGERYCTVPMVITKQIYRLTEDKFRQMDKRIDNLYSIVENQDEERGRLFSQANLGMVCSHCIHYDKVDEDFGNCRVHKRVVTKITTCRKGEFKP